MSMLFYQLIILCSLLVFLVILILNLKEFRSLPEKLPVGYSPFVSVLIPARNEERNIGRCVASLLSQDYDRFELVVLNDGSTDRTGEILKKHAAEVPEGRMRIMQGKPLPEGWHGKAWACDQLGREAKGEILLFTDADTVHMPGSIGRSVAALRQNGGDMLSLTPRQEMESFWEKLVVPLMYFVLFCYLPLRLITTNASTAFCFANGQFIMFTRRMYRLINGHQSVKNDLVEDVWLCKSVKKAGGNVVIYNGIDAVQCRMYRNLGEIWEGFSKNLFAGLGYNTLGLSLLLCMTTAVYILPYFFLYKALTAQVFSLPLFWIPLLQIFVALMSRVLLAVRFCQPVTHALLHVISQIMLLGIAANSYYLVRFGKGSQWKGRRYNFSGKGV